MRGGRRGGGTLLEVVGSTVGGVSRRREEIASSGTGSERAQGRERSRVDPSASQGPRLRSPGTLPRGTFLTLGGDTPLFLVDRIRSVPGVSPHRKLITSKWRSPGAAQVRHFGAIFSSVYRLSGIWQ